MLKNLVSLVRSLFGSPAPKTEIVYLPAAPAKPTMIPYTVDRTVGGRTKVVAWGEIDADTPSAALALIVGSGKAFPGEAVNIDGTRWRIWTNARPTPIDPAKRNHSGDRRRDREAGYPAPDGSRTLN